MTKRHTLPFLRERVEMYFAHREVLSIVGQQRAPAFDRDRSNDGIGESEGVPLSGPSIFQLACEPSGCSSKLKAFQTFQKGLGLRFFAGPHPGVQFGDI